MSLIVDAASGSKLLAPAVHTRDWTVVIAAAGRGTRLGFDKPKILFPVGGVTILDRLTDLFGPLCDAFVFVLSPEGAPLVQPHITGRVAMQAEPRGMGDAVSCGVAAVGTAFTAVVWGDQFALRRESLEFCMRLLEGSAKAEAVCPTLLRARPYIHFERDSASNRIVTVLQKREGDTLPEQGESDSGVFFFRTDALKRRAAELVNSPASLGAKTKELNFLPVFAMMDATEDALITPRIMTEAESVGINSPEDAAYFEVQCR